MHHLKATLATFLLAGLAGAAGATTTNGIGNGSFETPPNGDAGYFAAYWQAAPTGNPALLSNQAHTGAHSALLTVPNGFGASTLFQDTAWIGAAGQLTSANVGDTPVLSFWAKGDVSTTGNILFAVRYLGPGGILADSGNQFFQGAINASGWTQINFQAAAIPTGATSIFLEMNTAVGPLLDGRPNAVYIDDIQFTLTTAAVPEPGSYALLLAGLVAISAVGAITRRRRA